MKLIPILLGFFFIFLCQTTYAQTDMLVIDSFENFGLGLVFGILLFLFFYNLWIYRLVQKSIYQIFILSCSVDILFICHYIKPNLFWTYFGTPSWSFYLYYPLSLLAIAARIWFMQRFLATNLYAPLIDKILTGIKGVSLLSLMLTPLGYLSLGVYISCFLFILLSIITAIATIYRIRQGGRDATYFLFTNMISLLAMLFVIWQFVTVGYVDFASCVVIPLSEIFYFIILSQTLAGQINELRKEVIKKESIMKSEKERISRDLHDNIGSQLTYLVRSLDRIKDSQGQTKIEELSVQTKNIIEELRNTIWVLNKESLSLKEFETKILGLLWQMKPQSGETQFSLDRNGLERGYITANQAINLYRIVQEALHNSIKYSESSIVKVEINTHEFAYKPFQLSIRIIDDGKGFDMKELPAVNKSNFGLQNMEHRASEIGGTLFIQSTKGIGTVVEVHL